MSRELKRIEKERYTTVAMFRLMAGIPPDPRICPDNLTFEVDVDDIIERYSRNCGHDASIMTCGSCGINDIMVGMIKYFIS